MRIKQFTRYIMPVLYMVLFAYYMIASLLVGVIPALDAWLYVVYVVGFLVNALHFVLLLKNFSFKENSAFLSLCSFVNFVGTLCAVGGLIQLLW